MAKEEPTGLPLKLDAARAFVESIELPAAPRPRRGAGAALAAPVFEPDKKQGIVVGSEIISFVEPVSAEQREIIVNCSLLAQLAANKKVPSRDQVLKWYDVYFDTLTHLGWSIQERGFSEHRDSGTDFEMHQAIIAVASVVLGPASTAFVAVMSTLNAMKEMSSGKWITVFKRESQSGKVGRFQMAVVEADAQGMSTISMMAFHLEVTNSLTQVLFFKFRSADATLRHASGKVALDAALLNDLRPAVAAKVAAHTRTFVADLAIDD
jgi:hypothetical protein